MAAPRNRLYRHRGVHIPFVPADEENQWSSDTDIPKGGFIFIHRLKGNVLSVQSVGTGDIFINKLLQPDRTRNKTEQAEELRISTAPDAERRLLGPLLVRGVMRTYFNELALWQRIGDGTYSLYLNFYNGGALDKLWDCYNAELRPIPEHFIWHVFLTLIEAVRWLHTGAVPGTNDVVDGWTPIYHRDIAVNNIFLQYTHRPDTEPEPVEGFETNAFPEVVLGDFGHGSLEGDELRRIQPGRWNLDETAPETWQDTFSIIMEVKELCFAHIKGHNTFTTLPSDIYCRDINAKMKADDTPYSNVLLGVLKLWEYTNCDMSLIDESQTLNGVFAPNTTRIPDDDYLYNTVLPLARRMVRRYRRPGKDMPKDWWRQLDVSWTKPNPSMPYEWMPVQDSVDNNHNQQGDDQQDDNQQDDNQQDDNQQGEDEEEDNEEEDNEEEDNEEEDNEEEDNEEEDNEEEDNEEEDNEEEDNEEEDNEEEDNEEEDNEEEDNEEEDNEEGDEEMKDNEEEDNEEGDEEMKDAEQDGGDDDIDSEISSSDYSIETEGERHICPKPNPVTNREILDSLINFEKKLPESRPPHRIVMLEYEQPVKLNVRQVPPPPGPDPPDSPPPSPPSGRGPNTRSGKSGGGNGGGDNGGGDGVDGGDGGGGSGGGNRGENRGRSGGNRGRRRGRGRGRGSGNSGNSNTSRPSRQARLRGSYKNM
ncbi:hypothetical protein HD806DRAFT_546068 [Xylariaceae sp. AK1471]|nr:hypothetical protein HD806DRAFT_546068 [Xylariaceae sp. AK1471]